MISSLSCILRCAQAWIAFLVLAAVSAADPLQLWPAAVPPQRFLGDNPPSLAAFRVNADAKVMTIAFEDHGDLDEYCHLDLGPVDLGRWREGGSLAVDLELDQPIMRLTAVVAEAGDLWHTRQFLEAEIRRESGPGTWRLWFDRISAKRAAGGRDHLYLFLHDLGGAARGKATLTITGIRLLPPGPGDWRAEKRAWYAKQFNQPVFPRIEHLYREDLARAEPWAPVAASPALAQASPGGWKRLDAGERTWDTAFLADTAFAQADFDDRAWNPVAVPEPAVADQPGGHRLYRATVELPAAGRGRTWLRCDDLCDWAELYVNGVRVGTQTSVTKHLDWVIENGSKVASTAWLPARKVLSWRQFDRCGVPWPFDLAAVPDGQQRLILPLGWGEQPWPLAFDISAVARPGRNTVAVRLYGNPMRGWWIYRHREDRAARNIHGILGEVRVAWTPSGGIAAVAREHPQRVEADGTALHRFVVRLAGPVAGARVRLEVAGRRSELDATGGDLRFEARLPASFARHQARLALVDPAGVESDARVLDFHATVVSAGAGGLLVNGEPFVVRGFNAALGVEWANDRRTTAAEFSRHLDLVRDLGFNSVRLEGPSLWHVQQAQERGLMVLPVVAAASTDYSWQALGRFDDPDLDQATDRHRLLGIQLGEQANVLAWNIGNELYSTPGYDDRALITRYLDRARDAVRAHDPYRRPTLYSNLDAWLSDGFYFGEQDIIGWNLYLAAAKAAPVLAETIPDCGGRPLLFTEIGEQPGEKARKGRVSAWEEDLAAKWRMTAIAPALGAFLYPFHGELDDQRGRDWLAALVRPVAIERSGEGLALRNREVAAMRGLRVELIADGRSLATVQADGLAAGAVLALPAAAGATQAEVIYETHRGLVHRYRLAMGAAGEPSAR